MYKIHILRARNKSFLGATTASWSTNVGEISSAELTLNSQNHSTIAYPVWSQFSQNNTTAVMPPMPWWLLKRGDLNGRQSSNFMETPGTSRDHWQTQEVEWSGWEERKERRERAQLAQTKCLQAAVHIVLLEGPVSCGVSLVREVLGEGQPDECQESIAL